jgi:hypothetical protein
MSDPAQDAIDAAEEYIPASDAEQEAGPCPVQILGHADLKLYCMPPSGQLLAVPFKQLDQRATLAIFENHTIWLYKRFPRHDKDGKPAAGFNLEAANLWMINSAGKAGVFDPNEDVRGLGCWRADDGALASPLVVHCGDQTLLEGKWYYPGRRGDFVYTYARPVPPPAAAPITPGQVKDLLRLLGRWHWAEPELAPAVVLGWVVSGMLAGALDKRPSMFISGDRQTGKTTLQKLLEELLKGWMLFLANTTEAAARQLLAKAARPIMVDEFEASEVTEKLEQVILLSRIAFDRGGGGIARGGQDGSASVYHINATFLFSSILRPAMRAQDMQRMIWLDLLELARHPDPETSAGPAATLADINRLAGLGPAILARVIDQWPRFAATLAVYVEALARRGNDSRTCDTYGTLFACQDLLTRDRVPEAEEAEFLAELVDFNAIAEARDETPDHERCLQHLVTSKAPVVNHGRSPTIGRLILSALAGDLTDQSILADCGIRVINAEDTIAVANSHAGLAPLFADTHWRARSGAPGGWVQSLRRLPGARPGGVMRIGGASVRATLLPAALFPAPAAVTQAPGGDAGATPPDRDIVPF